MAAAIFDASAVLAAIFAEPGRDVVARVLLGGTISAVSACEIWTKLLDKGGRPEMIANVIDDIGLTISDFTAADANMAAALRGSTRHAGLSLGDRACLALARRMGLPVYTADRAWTKLDVGLDIRLIR